MNGVDMFLEQFADVVARRVIEMQRVEAEKSKTVYLTPAEMAARLGVTQKTLANLRSAKKGPPFTKVGGLVRYPVKGA